MFVSKVYHILNYGVWFDIWPLSYQEDAINHGKEQVNALEVGIVNLHANYWIGSSYRLHFDSVLKIKIGAIYLRCKSFIQNMYR